MPLGLDVPELSVRHVEVRLAILELGRLRQEHFYEFNPKLGYMGTISFGYSETLSQITNKSKIKTVGW